MRTNHAAFIETGSPSDASESDFNADAPEIEYAAVERLEKTPKVSRPKFKLELPNVERHSTIKSDSKRSRQSDRSKRSKRS